MLLALLLTYALALLLPTSVTASWAQDCDAGWAHCFHGPPGSTMQVPDLVFDLHAGEIRQKGIGTRGNLVYLLSENASGSVTFNCKIGQPSKYLFTVGPSYSYLEAKGLRGDLSKGQFIGSYVRVSYAANDKLADVTHQGGIDVVFMCREPGQEGASE